MTQSVSVEAAVPADLDAVSDCIAQQERRWAGAENSPLGTKSYQWLSSAVLDGGHRSLVARDRLGRILGFAAVQLWNLTTRDEILAFFRPRNGVARYLALPAPELTCSKPVAAALLGGLQEVSAEWQTHNTVVSWSSADTGWIEPLFLGRGFILDGYIAVRAASPFEQTRCGDARELSVRRATSGDLDAFVHLFMEEERYHERVSPICRLFPELETAFRARLSQLLSTADADILAPGSRSPLLLMAEVRGAVVGMLECYVVPDTDLTYASTFSAGTLAYIANVSVAPSMRGKGVGHALMAAVSTELSDRRIDGYFLVFSAYNPLSSRFWRQLGFVPVRTIYQKRK